MRYFIELSYNGSPYHGWQRQPNAITVQEEIENALSTLLREKMSITGAGRTDTGVHAKQMFAHFDSDVAQRYENVATANDRHDFVLQTENSVSHTLPKLRYKLNAFLPAAIAIHRIFPVPEEAHTRFDAIARTYTYRITTQKNPFEEKAAFYFKHQLDVNAMNSAATFLLSHSDFKCFSKSNTEVNTYLCRITKAVWKEAGNQLEFTITADRFLRNMVRAVVGTLLEIGIGKQSVSWMSEVLESKNRSVAGASVPAHGLYLTEIEYPKSIMAN